ncbi:MAG: Peroxiredoxin [Betaproteobacteria bacterium]|nr:Peroxiredoxin [Betaproteobacteria bacterium]
MLSPGVSAPEFHLADADMALVNSSEYRGKRAIVLYFYDKDNLPGSTMEAIEFSDLEEDFQRFNCVILGVSPDDWMSHAEFRDRHGLSIRLLSDPECEVCRSYDVVKASGATPNGRPHVLRSTFVIDRLGKVRHALYGVSPKGHAAEVLNLVKTLKH